MKITIKTELWRDYRESLEIEVDYTNENDNGETQLLRFYDGEPEDNNLARNFSDCHRIVGMMELAYKAGRDNKPFTVIELPVESDRPED